MSTVNMNHLYFFKWRTMEHGGAREGAGRKHKWGEESVRLFVSAPAGLVDKLEKYANKKGLSRSEAAVVAIAKEVGYKLPNRESD